MSGHPPGLAARLPWYQLCAASFGAVGLLVILLPDAGPFITSFATALGVAAASAGFLEVSRPVDRALFVVAAVFVFAYFARYVAIRIDPEVIYFLVPSVAWPAFESEEILRLALAYTCATFLAAASAAAFLRLTWLAYPSRRREAHGDFFMAAPPTRLILLAGIAVILSLDLLMLANGIGVQGQFVEQPLPFKLTGAIVYLKTVIVPCFALVYVYWCERAGTQTLARVAIGVMLASGAADMALFSSRGALLQIVLFVGLLWWVTRFKVRKSDLVILSCVVMATLLAVPAITAFRLFGSDFDAISSGLDTISLSQVAIGVTFVFFRITGIDQFMVILDMAAPIPRDILLEVLNSPRGIAGFYTSEILLFPEDVPQTFAPSGLGWLYLVGGAPGMVIGGVMLAVLVVAGWKAIESLLPRLAPVAKSYFLLQLIVLCTEGIVGSVFKSMLIALAAYWVLEQLLRLFVPRGANAMGKAREWPARRGKGRRG